MPDVVIIGGAFSGAAAAILLRRQCPSLSVTIVEKADAFDEKVGEATTEMSAMFLTRRLGLWDHLHREHLPKEGLRYWFSNQYVTDHSNASETGGFLRSAVPAFQLRRDALDEHLLSLARVEGAEIVRPARVRDVQLGDFDSSLTISTDSGERTLRTRWVLDASGRAQFLGSRLGIMRWNEDHPIASIWARWTDIRNIDDLAARTFPQLAQGNIGSRRLATNHYMGRGYWIWVIPLGNSQTSIGIVFDKRTLKLHEQPDRRATYENFLRAIPSLAELLDGAHLREEDLRSLSRVAYRADAYMGKGWALLGDAAAFIDPYYSPGLDHACFTVEASTRIIREHHRGRDITPDIAAHNRIFTRSYDRFFRSVYRDKYDSMNEHDLVSAAFLMDTAQYYIFTVIPSYRFFKKFQWMPVMGPQPAALFALFIRFYNRRFRALANLRRRKGLEGHANNNRRIKAYYNLNLAPLHMFARGLKLWLKAELGGIRLHFKRDQQPHPTQRSTSTAETTVATDHPTRAVTSKKSRGRKPSKIH